MQESRYDMKHTRFAKVLVAMFAGVLMVAALGGCAQQDTAAAQQQSENRQYMTQSTKLWTT